jgi:SAM-dependent methyltransferase
MQADPRALARFYASATGRMAARMLAERIGALWPDLSRQRLLGLGWTAPYLPLWADRVGRLSALIPAELGPAGWPEGQDYPPGAVAVGEEERLPFGDLCFDRVLVVHGLEASGSARRMLREIWRVLADEGVVLFVVPNRRGLWAHLEGTPFGHGQPYSQGQMSRLLGRHLFAVERCDSALFCPPFPWAPLLAGAAGWDRAGRRVAPAFAGVVLVEARKSMLGALPAGAALGGRAATSRQLLPETARGRSPGAAGDSA